MTNIHLFRMSPRCRIRNVLILFNALPHSFKIRHLYVPREYFPQSSIYRSPEALHKQSQRYPQRTILAPLSLHPFETATFNQTLHHITNLHRHARPNSAMDTHHLIPRIIVAPFKYINSLIKASAARANSSRGTTAVRLAD